MTTTIDNGRLCNQLFRNLAVSLIAEKNDLYVNYFNYHLFKKLGINLFIGSKIHDNTIQLTDDNYFHIYNLLGLCSNLNGNTFYFQTRSISNLIYNYLNSSTIKSNIFKMNPFNERYNNNNDLCIHIRLTDVQEFNPGLNYYLNTINKIQFDDLYICSDDVDHNIIIEIKKKHPNTKIIKYDEIRTIQFASTCKNIILSHGSFSAIIGYLSFFSNVNYLGYQHNGYDLSKGIWFGDMFSIDGWIKHDS